MRRARLLRWMRKGAGQGRSGRRRRRRWEDDEGWVGVGLWRMEMGVAMQSCTARWGIRRCRTPPPWQPGGLRLSCGSCGGRRRARYHRRRAGGRIWRRGGQHGERLTRRWRRGGRRIPAGAAGRPVAAAVERGRQHMARRGPGSYRTQRRAGWRGQWWQGRRCGRRKARENWEMAVRELVRIAHATAWVGDMATIAAAESGRWAAWAQAGKWWAAAAMVRAAGENVYRKRAEVGSEGARGHGGSGSGAIGGGTQEWTTAVATTGAVVGWGAEA